MSIAISITVCIIGYLILCSIGNAEGKIMKELRKTKEVEKPAFVVIYTGNNLFLASEITKQFCECGYRAYYNKSGIVVWADEENLLDFTENIGMVLDAFAERIGNENTFKGGRG